MTGPELTIHVGMPRSRTILLTALRRLRPQLRQNGIAYVGGGQVERTRHVNGWAVDEWARPDEATAFEKGLARVVAAEAARAGALWRRASVPRILASNLMLGRGEIGPRDGLRFRPFAERALGQVVEAVSVGAARVVLHTHRQDRLMELAYLRRLQAGQHGAFEDYFPYWSQPVLDYRDLVERIGAVRGVTEVIVRPVELADAGTHAFVNDFLAPFGIADRVDLHQVGHGVPSHPVVYSARGAQLARAMNPLLDTADEISHVSGFLQQNFSASDFGDSDVLERSMRTKILDVYAESNRELFARYMPDLPIDSYVDEAATFALGNVLHQPAARKVRSSAVADRLTSGTIVARRYRRRITARLPGDLARRVGGARSTT